MSVFTEYIPENDRRSFAFEIGKAEFFRPVHDLGIIAPRLTQTSEVAFDIGHKHRNTPCAEIFRKRLERYRFAGSGRTGDQAVTIGHFREEVNWLPCLRDEDWIVHKGFESSVAAVSDRR
jgi:hypothetical protein